MNKTNIFLIGDEKKHSVVYNCTDADALARSIYVNKIALGPKPYPAVLEITMKEVRA